MKMGHVGSHFVSGDVKKRPPDIETYQYLRQSEISSSLFLALNDPARRPSPSLIATRVRLLEILCPTYELLFSFLVTESIWAIGTRTSTYGTYSSR